jgi:hypothetical protein
MCGLQLHLDLSKISHQSTPNNRSGKGSNRFAQRIPAVVEVGALQNEENTRYCGSRLTCTTDSGIFASAGMNRK